MTDDDEWMDDQWDDEVDEADDFLTSCPHCGKQIYDESEQCPHCRMFITDNDLAYRGWHLKPIWVYLTIVIIILMIASWHLR